MKLFTASALGVFVAGALSASASVSYSITGSTYSQTFDSLPITPSMCVGPPTGWTDDNAAPGSGNFSIAGWYLWAPIVAAEGGFNGHQRVRIGPGSSTTGAFMSWAQAVYGVLAWQFGLQHFCRPGEFNKCGRQYVDRPSNSK